MRKYIIAVIVSALFVYICMALVLKQLNPNLWSTQEMAGVLALWFIIVICELFLILLRNE